MGDLGKFVIGTIIVIIIGGTAYTVSQSDVIRNFAEDTGLTQEQAELWINEIPEELRVSWDEAGYEFINDGQELLNIADEIDCVNRYYEWESFTLSCSEGKAQITKFARDGISLGQAYVKLGSDSASLDDARETIRLIDQLNSDYQFEIVSALFDRSEIDDSQKIDSYNKALLKTVLESN